MKVFTHVERLSSDDAEGILDNPKVSITAKLDGTNASVWATYDAKGNVTYHCGSRTRELSAEKDNAGFYAWFMSDGEEQNALKKFLCAYPAMTIFGEWLGSDKFIGAIKDYNKSAIGIFWIFDVYNLFHNEYLWSTDWRKLLTQWGLGKFFIKEFGIYDHPTLEQIEEIASHNAFLLDSADHPGEGVVIKAADEDDNIWCNKYGHLTYGKLVLAEYIQKKSKPKKVAATGDVEKDIVAEYQTESEMAKTKEKVCVMCGVDVFDLKSAKMNGMFISFCWKDLLEETGNWVKKHKNPTVNFGILKSESAILCRKYLGLI